MHFTHLEDKLYSKISFTLTPSEFFEDIYEPMNANIKVPKIFSQLLATIIPLCAKKGSIEKAFDALITKIFIRGLEECMLEWQKKRVQAFIDEVEKKEPEIAMIMYKEIMKTSDRIRNEGV